ncbi:DUF5753 domain-containing protein [Streptomyces sp. NPDC056831]|uniref:DUF5753 domain-containing protein n=1 Tax=Streptomyces sp. NPDC056831 TaxID=3345954 RepID=UPI0036938BC4
MRDVLFAGSDAASGPRARSSSSSHVVDLSQLGCVVAAVGSGHTRHPTLPGRREISCAARSGVRSDNRNPNHARTMRIASVIHIPGLLQTREHARVVIGDVVPAMAPYEVEHRVSHRLKRQAVVHGKEPTPLTAIVHEAALRMGFGGQAVARDQLQYMIDRSEEAHLTVLVVPFGIGTFPGAGHGIVQFGGQVPPLDTVQLDTDHGSVFVDGVAQLAKYRTVLDRMEACALGPSESRDLILCVMRSL